MVACAWLCLFWGVVVVCLLLSRFVFVVFVAIVRMSCSVVYCCRRQLLLLLCVIAVACVCCCVFVVVLCVRV